MKRLLVVLLILGIGIALGCLAKQASVKAGEPAVALELLAQGGTKYTREFFQEPLIGMKAAIGVLVEPISDEAKSLGLSESAIHTEVEIKLRQSGFRILTRADRLRTKAGPLLYVNVNAAKNIAGFVASLSVELRERVILQDRVLPNRETLAATWSADTVLPDDRTGGRYRGHQTRTLSSRVLSQVRNYTSLFCNDYLAAQEKLKKK